MKIDLGPRWAVSGVFLLTGVGTANWAVRIPAVQRSLQLSDGQLGIALLGVSVGAIAAMPVSGRLVARYGSRPVTWAGAIAFAIALTLPPLAPSFGLLLAALVALGLTNGILDVAMNAQAAAVQTKYSQPIMVRIHAFYSFGGLIGAAIGGSVAARGIGPAPHLAGVGVAIAIGASIAVARMLPAHTDAAPHIPFVAGQLRALIALGVLAFCVLFGEGAMMNWSAVYLRNVIGTGPGLAAAGFASFSLMMATGRAVGDTLTSRLGAERLTRIGGAIALCGIGLALAFPQPLPVVIGFGAVGAGLAIIFPLTLAAAARTPGVVPGAAIAVVSMCGYSGLLAGPPLIGTVANFLTLRGGLALVALASIGVVILSRAVRTAPGQPFGDGVRDRVRPTARNAVTNRSRTGDLSPRFQTAESSMSTERSGTER
ncbi:MAG: permease of the major facilitator superfamily [Gemmatimonadetes bacterium]|nr:permease of the major facilitator superfamily [Gemmatimonadota bacterium]